MGQPVACTELVVLMLTDVRRAHPDSAAWRKVFVELPAEACTDKGKVGRLLRSMYGCRDAGVKREFAMCQVMIGIGFVQGRASQCTHRHFEKQLRVWVEGDDFVRLRYIINVKCFFLFFAKLFPDSAISPPILLSCSSHTEACNALGTTDGVTSH